MSTKNPNESNKKSGGKRRKIPGMSKKDKGSILRALIDSDVNSTSLFDAIASIDPDVLKKSVSHILNSHLDYDSLARPKQRTIDAFLEDMHTVFRFAPAPSGELHIGHVVPILLNAILSRINQNYGRKSTMIVRIDDTDPDVIMNRSDNCSGISIMDTLQKFLRTDLESAGIICYNSSDYVDQIVGTVVDSIRSGANHFYPDLTPQADIKTQRAERSPSPYRSCNANQRNDILDQLLSGQYDGVIRAKIDHASDNGNLRDPVMIRFKVDAGLVWQLPTYDLVCPVLDLFDSYRFDKDIGAHTLVALRDCNYVDRLDQYLWIQKALQSSTFTGGDTVVPHTSMITFSRISIEDALLSKRKIKQLIVDGVVGDWDDPRLFTLPGILNRGITLAGLANFYWVIGTMSTSNRVSTVTQTNFFAHYDKVLSRTSTPILNRIPSGTDVPADAATVYDAEIISYRNVILSVDSTADDPSITPVCSGTFKIDLDQIITNNLMNHKKVDVDFDSLNTVGVWARDTYDDLVSGDFGHLFGYGMDIVQGQIVKINNFKDNPTEVVYGGFYLIKSIDHDSKKIVFSSISQ
jgi:glutamyl/glutaminyl-tRNA synthetase